MSEYSDFLKQQLEEINPYENFDEDTNLIESEILDSLTIVFLVTQMEDKFHITIDEKLIIPANFITIKKIEELLIAILNK